MQSVAWCWNLRPASGWFLVGLGLLLGTLKGASGEPESAPNNGPICPIAGEPAVTELLAPICQRRDLPAMAGAIVTGHGLQVLGAVGVRKRGTDVAVTTNDLWHLGSDTKAMTATLAARLVERGKLKWDSTVSEVFPELAPDFDPGFKEVTLRHLLAHRAGVVPNLNWARIAREGTLQEQRLEAVKEGLSRKPLSTPGSTYLYSNLGYVIAGAMIERVTGRPWEESMRREIFVPLKMPSAGFGGLGTPGEIDQPWGHLKGGKPVKDHGPAVDNPPVLGPAGTVHCTLQDWAKFIADQLRGLRGEPGLLQPESYQVLAKPSFGGDYALGWLAVERAWGGGTVLNHCGCNTMYYANAWLAPARDFAVLVCANQGLDAFDATDEAVSALIDWQNRHSPAASAGASKTAPAR